MTQRIAHELAALIATCDYYIDLHTGGTTLDVWPLAGYMLHPKRNILDVQRRMARAMNLPVVWGTDPSLEGRSLSARRDADVPAIYAEFGGGGNCCRGVAAYVEGCLEVMRELGMQDGSRRASSVCCVVEDSRKNSGHLQIQNPSPANGFFEPAVALGQPIENGQKLGTVFDVLGRSASVVHSNQAGLVLTLRVCPRVAQGDMLAVILETHNALGGV